jgi:membrane fusion protein, multidrug efflux system
VTQHSTTFEIERPVPAATAVGDLLPGSAAVQIPAKKFNIRKALFTGVALVALAGAAWYGWDYWTVGQYQVSTDDAYVRPTTRRSRQKFRVTSTGCWSGIISR